MPALLGKLQQFLSGGLIRNILSLYGVQAAHQVLQLLTIPYLSRTLGPSEWGRLAVAQSVALFTQLIVNYGFPFAATRAVARNRDDESRLAEIVSDVLGAQLILAVVTALGAIFVSWMWLPILMEDPKFLVFAIFAGVLGGVLPMWFFQGQERLGRVASLDMAGKIITALGLFIFVRHSNDGWKMLAMQGTSSLVVIIIACREITTRFHIRIPSLARIKATFADGFDMFIFTSAGSTLSIGNVLLLGLFAPPNVIGYYAGAEKLGRAFVGFLWPLNQALFPRINHLCHTDPPAGARLVLRSMAIMGGAGLFMGGGCFILAPLVINILLGPGFEPAIPALRIISLMVMIIPLSIVLGLQWAVSMGFERAYSRVILAAVGLNVFLAWVLVPRFGHLGMAATVTLVEFSALVAVIWLLHRNNLNPFRIARQKSEPPPAPPASVSTTAPLASETMSK